MSCCASRRPALDVGVRAPAFAPRHAATPQSLGAPPRPLQLVYERTSPTPLLLTGAASGRIYHFRVPGERLVADARDAAQLARTPGLRRV